MAWPSAPTAAAWPPRVRTRPFGSGRSLPGRSFATLTGHTGPVYGVVFSLDGRRVISAGGDKLIKVWDPEIAQVPALHM